MIWLFSALKVKVGVCVLCCLAVVDEYGSPSGTGEGVIPRHNPNAETPSEVYNNNDS